MSLLVAFGVTVTSQLWKVVGGVMHPRPRCSCPREVLAHQLRA